MNTIPTLSQLSQSIIADIESALGITLATFGKVYLRAVGLAQAGVVRLLYLQLALIQKNIFADLADPESTGGTLERFGRIKLGRDPFPATAGQYTIEIVGTAGASIPAQTTFLSDDDSSNPGQLFILDSGYVLTGTGDSFTVRALVAGTESQLSVGDTLTPTIPLVNITIPGEVTVEVVEPLDAETIEDYRSKVLQAYRLETQGGAGADYRLWSFDAQGVAQAYPYAKSGAPGEINVFVEATIADSTDGKGTPSQSILDAVEDVIEYDPDTTKALSERGRRPLGVFQVHVLPVTIREVDITINSFVDLDASIETLIEDALIEAVNLVRPFVASVDALADRNDILDTNKIIAAIIQARPGSVFGTVVLSVDSVPLTSFQFIDGDIPHFNSITFA